LIIINEYKISIVNLSNINTFYVSDKPFLVYKIDNLNIYRLSFLIINDYNTYNSFNYISEDNMIFYVKFDDDIVQGDYCIGLNINEFERVISCERKVIILPNYSNELGIITNSKVTEIKTNFSSLVDKYILEYTNSNGKHIKELEFVIFI